MPQIHISAEADNLCVDKIEEDKHVNKLYITSKWRPPNANSNSESRIKNFAQALHLEQEKIKQSTKPATNVTPEVESLIKDVTSNKQFIVLMTDKNLGPAIIKREQYICAVLAEHLLVNQTYQRLSKHKAA